MVQMPPSAAHWAVWCLSVCDLNTCLSVGRLWISREAWLLIGLPFQLAEPFGNSVPLHVANYCLHYTLMDVLVVIGS